MEYAFALIFVPALFSIGLSSGLEPELVLQRVEQTTGFEIIRSNIRVTKFNRTCAVVNGTLDFLVDMDNNITVTFERFKQRVFHTFSNFAFCSKTSFKWLWNIVELATTNSTYPR